MPEREKDPGAQGDASQEPSEAKGEASEGLPEGAPPEEQPPEATGESAQEARAAAESPPEKQEQRPEAETPAAAERPTERAAARERAAAEGADGKATPPPPGGIADLIAQALPDMEVQASEAFTHTIVEIARDDVPKAMPVLKDDPRLDLKFLRSLFAVDHLEEGMEVVYHLMSLEKGHDVAVKTRLSRDDLKVASVTSLWKAADWHERETRDMFGIEFEGHPHLVPLLLPEFMTDHFPLRKDNALAEIEEWQGELVPEGEEAAEGDGEAAEA